jgi:hypothetical protein
MQCSEVYLLYEPGHIISNLTGGKSENVNLNFFPPEYGYRKYVESRTYKLPDYDVTVYSTN